MKKAHALFIFALLIVVALVLTGCSHELDEELVGTWSRGYALDMYPNMYYVFNDDGSGYRENGNGPDIFVWSTNDGYLRLNRANAPAGERRVETWLFDINGDSLTLTYEAVFGRVYSYFRQ
ncbi:MAG: hypothetical protein FWC92_00070 [Defluviitaleaceae bacterium]|nr:hypothetical protein [Defluviitaleaceae bacterium]